VLPERGSASALTHTPGYHARMSLSVFDIFKIGIGPSSSHTMGPMNAARDFAELLAARHLLDETAQVSAQLYGSLALTGRGHCTDRAVLLGLEGMSPDTIDSTSVDPTLQRIRGTKRLRLLGRHEIEFDEPLNLLFHTDQVLPGHSNGMRFTAPHPPSNSTPASNCSRSARRKAWRSTS